MKQESVSFDHAAAYYDATRALPPDLAGRVTDALATEIREAGGRALEAGIGTGRIARPLLARGIRITGVDISPRMLWELRAQLTPAHAGPDLMLGDATRLPFCDGAFSSVLVCHVLHLVSDLHAAVREMRRVLAAGGVVLHHTDRDADPSRWERHSAKWREMLAARGRQWRPRVRLPEINGAFEDAGGRHRTEVVAQWVEDGSVEEMLARTRERVHSWTWEIPEDVFFDCLPEYEEWARANVEDRREAVYEIDVWRFR